MELDYKKTTQDILKNLPDRTKAVLSRRFALGKSTTPETLDAIGKSYNITRERVRQIESDGIKRAKKVADISEAKEEFKKIKSFFEKKLDACGGVQKEEELLAEIKSKEEKNCVLFLLSLVDSISKEKEDDKFNSFFVNDKKLVAGAKKLSSEMVDFLKANKVPQTLEGLYAEFKKRGVGLEKEAFRCYSEISKDILKTIDNKKIGLKSWPEVNPKTVKDKIKLILKEKEKPLHFKEIAEMIFGMNESLAGEKRKKLHPQTVHNELIRNQDFVLVGRGYYALKDWGYNPGQVKDVIYSVLKSSDSPLKKEEVVKAVLDQRMVKESTVLLNLQNKKLFQRDGEGRYNVREA
jgi:predicted Zn-ribbon and HTH transcriptional regulator